MEDTDVLTWVLAIGIPLGLAAGGVAFWWWRRPRDEEVHYFRCPGCRRKLRYYARQVGHRGMCNNCKEQFQFPTPLHHAHR